MESNELSGRANDGLDSWYQIVRVIGITACLATAQKGGDNRETDRMEEMMEWPSQAT